MTDSRYFELGYNVINDNFDSPLELENWMVDSNFFDMADNNSDSPLKLESWMVNDNFWAN